MRRVIGFALFFMAIGMIVMLLLRDVFWGIVIVIGLLMLGYHLFCC